MSVGELAMTPRIWLVAVCCSKRLGELLEQPHVLDGDHRLVGEGFEQRDLLVGERSDFRATNHDGPDGQRLRGAAEQPVPSECHSLVNALASAKFSLRLAPTMSWT